MAKFTKGVLVLGQWGGRRDLNPRQPDPQSGALTKLSYGHRPSANVGFHAPGVKLMRGTREAKGTSCYNHHDRGVAPSPPREERVGERRPPASNPRKPA
jgi:hypothetical protein